eukprot:TRINITY_DN6808_c0_g1_i3.p1 TRINITY_DN6808_c0_g1~~TRINITY_DN6808_c0_g1_i3.p1  ORF type:complete len:181 (+),score=33.98 TRINITY_DN6808_c0_g1_i3:40-543(+)
MHVMWYLLLLVPCVHACTGITNYTVCTSDPSCVWDFSVYPVTCRDECSVFGAMSTCNGESHCLWDGSACVSIDCSSFADACTCKEHDRCYMSGARKTGGSFKGGSHLQQSDMVHHDVFHHLHMEPANITTQQTTIFMSFASYHAKRHTVPTRGRCWQPSSKQLLTHG